MNIKLFDDALCKRTRIELREACAALDADRRALAEAARKQDYLDFALANDYVLDWWWRALCSWYLSPSIFGSIEGEHAVIVLEFRPQRAKLTGAGQLALHSLFQTALPPEHVRQEELRPEFVLAVVRADRLPHVARRVRQILRGDGYVEPATAD
jgi:hypothetical protein